MRKLSIVLMFLFTTIITLPVFGGGSYPDSLLPELKKYPIDKYIFGVGVSNKAGPDGFKEAVADASKNVAMETIVRVANVIRANHNDLNYDIVKEHYSSVMEDYCRGRYAFPALKLEGLKARNLSVDNLHQVSKTYALVYIERDELMNIYASHVIRIEQEIKQRLRIANNNEKTLDLKGTVNAYLRTYPLYESLKEAEIIQIGAKYLPNYDDAFNKLVDAATRTEGNPLPHRSVIKRVEQLEQPIIVDKHDIANAVYSQITYSGQRHMSNVKVSLHPLVYKDSEMVSPFAVELTDALQQKFRWTFVDLAREFKQTPINIKNLYDDYPDRLTPSIWHNGDEVTIRATLRNVNTGEFHGSAVVKYLTSQLRDNFTYIPDRYEKVQKEKEVFHPLYIVSEPTRSNTDTTKTKNFTQYESSPIGGLKVDIWTNKGRGPLSYTEDDMVTVYARVNQPVYLRLLNTHADLKRALLVDNFPIGPENVDKVVEIGEFICAPPFGVEFLNVAARTEKFDAIETYEEGGYFYLVEQDREKAIKRFRGLKPIPKDGKEKHFIGPKPILDEQPDFQQIEAQLVITTMEK